MTEPTTNDTPTTLEELGEPTATEDSVTVYTILIDRDPSTKIPATVPFYEMPVVESIYGEDHVVVLSEEVVDGVFDARTAYDNLVAKYEKHENAVKVIYPSVHMFARQTGLGLDVGTVARRQPQSMSKVHTPAAKATKAAKTTAKKTTK